MDPKYLENTERDIRTRARMLDQKRKSIGAQTNRINISSDIALKLGAAAIDLLGFVINLIPAIGNVSASLLSIGGSVLMFFVYYMLGVKPSYGKKEITAKLQRTSTSLSKSSMFGNAFVRSIKMRLAAVVAELIPIVNALPMFSVAVWYTNYVVRKEDKEQNMSMRGVLEEIRREEAVLQIDMKRYTQMVQEYEMLRYNNEVQRQEREERQLEEQINEATITNAVIENAEDDEDRRAA